MDSRCTTWLTGKMSGRPLTVTPRRPTAALRRSDQHSVSVSVTMLVGVRTCAGGDVRPEVGWVAPWLTTRTSHGPASSSARVTEPATRPASRPSPRVATTSRSSGSTRSRTAAVGSATVTTVRCGSHEGTPAPATTAAIQSCSAGNWAASCIGIAWTMRRGVWRSAASRAAAATTCWAVSSRLTAATTVGGRVPARRDSPTRACVSRIGQAKARDRASLVEPRDRATCPPPP